MAGKTAAAGTQPGSNLRIKVDAAAAAAEKAASGESRAVEHVAELHPSQVPACLEQCLCPFSASAAVWTYIYMYTCVYVCICMYICVCICIIYMHIGCQGRGWRRGQQGRRSSAPPPCASVARVVRPQAKEKERHWSHWRCGWFRSGWCRCRHARQGAQRVRC